MSREWGPETACAAGSAASQDSVPLYAHGLAEYGVGGLSILAPFLFSFGDTATAGLDPARRRQSSCWAS